MISKCAKITANNHKLTDGGGTGVDSSNNIEIEKREKNRISCFPFLTLNKGINFLKSIIVATRNEFRIFDFFGINR